MSKIENKELDEYINKNPIKEESAHNETMPEAKSSVSYTLVSKDGFSLIFTCRSRDEAELLELMGDLENAFITRGYQADRKYTPKQQPLPVETGEICPKCKAPLVTFAKGVKCSTNKWDPETKKAIGCDYVKWNDAPSSTGGTTGGLATPAQERLLVTKGRFVDGMTKAEASKLISEIMGK